MGRGKNWSCSDDQSLCRAWVHCRGDFISGSHKQGLASWSKIMDFARAEGLPRSRNLKSAQSRWFLINSTAQKFQGVWKRLRPACGTKAEDHEEAAQQEYRALADGKSFDFMHCWSILSSCPKWAECSSESGSSNAASGTAKSTANTGSQGGHSDSGEDSDAESGSSRPKGVKRAKFDLQDSDLMEKVLHELKVSNAIAKEGNFDHKLGLALQYFSFPTEKVPESAKDFFAFVKAYLLRELSQTPAGTSFLGAAAK